MKQHIQRTARNVCVFFFSYCMYIFKAHSPCLRGSMKKRAKKKRKKTPDSTTRKRAKRSRPKGLYTYLYVLQSTVLNTRKSYVGVTNEPLRRIRQHNGALQGGARYTKKFRPWSFYAIFRFNSRRDALSVEWKVKHRRSKSDGPPGLESIINRIHRHGAGKKGFMEIV